MAMERDATRRLRVLADEVATRAWGRHLGQLVRQGDLIGLIGDLGAGKTTLVQGLVEGLGATVAASSPTFALIHEYPGGRMPVWHVDLYRIERAAELRELGLDEIIDRGRGLVVVEWSDRFPVLPPDHLQVELRHCQGGRELVTTALGPRSAELAQAWWSR
jgi:tRNA threonylcarbamoyladenosine biosynthesis protein TsaE